MRMPAISVGMLFLVASQAYAAEAQQEVREIIRAENSIHYAIDDGNDRRTLHLYNYPNYKAAVATDRWGQILSMTIATPNSRKDGFQKATFLFRPDSDQTPDEFSQAALRQASIAKLPIPRDSESGHWKNSASFLDAVENNDKPVIVTGGTMTMARQTQPVKDAICNPPVSVQLNSGLNACFRALCEYIECAEKNGTDKCFDEGSKASAYCLGSGTNEFTMER